MPILHELSALETAVQCYFDVLYECDLTKFDTLFHPACMLVTVNAGVDLLLTSAEYREILAKRSSPKSRGQQREESIHTLIALSDDAALVGVRVRIHEHRYHDHLNFIRVRNE